MKFKYNIPSFFLIGGLFIAFPLHAAQIQGNVVEPLSIETQLQKSLKKSQRITPSGTFRFISREKYSRDRMIASLAQSVDKQLRKLSEYKNTIPGNYGEEIMIFLHMPKTEIGVERLALNMSNIINEYKRHKIRPMFLFEPYDDNLAEIHFAELKNGSYDNYIKQLFTLLRDTYAISSEDIGYIIPYPEINTPAYQRKGFKPEDFSLMVNRFFASIRSVYPNILGGLLLDSKSYDIGEDWGDGETKSFLPYIGDIKPGTIQRFGIQGFPWVSKNKKIEAYDPKEFLPFGITHEAAKKLGVNSLWMNTGAMKRKYRENTVYISPEQSEKILSDILKQGKNFQENGYSVLLNVFAQDKFNHEEATDWGFLSDVRYTKVLERFIGSALSAGVKISIYDK